jgi:hypothetical protein
MDIKILDDEIINMGNEIKKTGEKLEALYQRYVNCMNTLGNDGIKDGDTSQNIKEYVSKMSRLNELIKGQTELVCDRCCSYISEIDRVDDFLF